MMWGALLDTRLYKRSQGRITRQVTFAALALVIGIGMWKLSATLAPDTALGGSSFGEVSVRYAIPGVLFLLGLWISFRIVNMPNFADFLIAVEGEMAKVSWPSRHELFRSSLVVVMTIFILATVLFLYDLIWRGLLSQLGVSI